MRLKKVLADGRRVESLDVLRGMAITMIFLTHFDVLDGKGIGVDLFFVLSGMLICKSLLLSHPDGKGISFKQFAIKRITKIIPSYYFFLIIGYFIARTFVSPISPADTPALAEAPQYFLFFRNYGGPPPRWTMEHVWSLCVEEHFYLGLMLSVFILSRATTHFAKHFNRLVFGAIGLGIFFKLQALFTDIAEWPTYSHNRMEAFGWGAWLYLVVYTDARLAHRVLNQRYLAGLGAGLLVAGVLGDHTPHQLILRTIAPFGWTLIILGIYDLKIPWSTVFKVLAYYSYSIYLWHFLFVIPIQHYLGTGVNGFLAYLLVTGLFAWVTTTFVEEKSLAMRNRWMSKINLVPVN